MIINLHFSPNFRSVSITYKEPVLMEAVAVLIMLSHHLQGFYVMSIISKCKIAMDILLLSSTETAILKNSHLVYWHFMLFFYHMQQIIYLGSPMLAGWLQQYGANYCRLVTVPSPMADRPPQRGLHPLFFANSVCQSLMSHRFFYMCKGCETGTTLCLPYPRRLESLIICKCPSATSSLLLGRLVLIQTELTWRCLAT